MDEVVDISEVIGMLEFADIIVEVEVLNVVKGVVAWCLGVTMVENMDVKIGADIECVVVGGEVVPVAVEIKLRFVVEEALAVVAVASVLIIVSDGVVL